MSSITFVFGMMCNRMAISRGASSWTGTLGANFSLGVIWVSVGIARWEVMPLAGWWQAAMVGSLFFLGQAFTFAAYRFGDVSVATPIFSTKILIVAFLSSLLSNSPVSGRIWCAALVATIGVALVQSGGRDQGGASRHRGMAITVLLAIMAALALSIFDLLLQSWGMRYGALRFLPVTFASAAMISLLFFRWVDPIPALRSTGALMPTIAGTALMSVQAMGMTIALSQFGDATRVNIVYALRGFWGVVLAWLFANFFQGGEKDTGRAVMIRRVIGATLLTAAVIAALA